MRKNVPDDQTQPSMLPDTVPPQATMFVAGDVGVMFFLLRMAFWLSIVLILLPTGMSQQPGNSVAATDAISAASATVGDLLQFCTRQPEACTVGSQVATELGYKAQAGAKMLYEFLTDSLAPKETGSVAANGARFGKAALDKPAMDQAAFNRASQNTLKATDVAPAWRGPAPRKDAKRSI